VLGDVRENPDVIPLKSVPSCGEIWTPSNPNGTAIGSDVFAGGTVITDPQTDRQTDRQTDYGTASVATGRI